MNTILFCHDTYYTQNKDGKIYAYGAFAYRLWQERFLPYCKHLTIIGRLQNKPDTDDTTTLDRSDGPNVTHILLDNINAPLKRLTQGRQTYKRIKQEAAKADGIIIRGPVEFGMLAAKAARALGKPYAVEMSGCAFDHTWNHGSLIGKLYAPVKYLRARHMVWHANQVIYVTNQFLQKRYPTKGLTESASNVEITAPPDEILQKRLNKIQSQEQPYHIGLIGNYGNNLKGLDVALNTLAKFKQASHDFKLHILGKGNPDQWQNQIEQAGLKDNIHFTGTLPGGKPVLDWLDQIDIYIQPSRHEGLPRAVIEAMSRGLPCLASDAGGTAELLPAQYIHKAGNADQLYIHLKSIWNDQKSLIEQTKTNFTTAQKYTKTHLAPIRAAFWTKFAKLK